MCGRCPVPRDHPSQALIHRHHLPRKDNRKLFIKGLNSLFEKLHLHHPDNMYIIAGDLNARTDWGDRISNARGRLLSIWEATDALNFKVNIFTPDIPTYTPAQSFLDVCLADTQIKIPNIKNKIKTLPLDSDHTALTFAIEILRNSMVLIDPHDIHHWLNFKATKGKRFTKNLNKNFKTFFPTDKNLTIQEGESFLHQILLTISQAINTSIPTLKPKNSIHKYLNNNIKKLQKTKSSLITLFRLIRLIRIDPSYSRWITKFTKCTLKIVKKTLIHEFSKAIDSFWSAQIKQIYHRKTESFFPKFNRLLRPKQPLKISDIHIDQENTSLLQRSKCNISSAPISKNKFIFSTPTDKLNTIGAFYESINSPRYLNSRTRHQILVDTMATSFKTEFSTSQDNSDTLTVFSDSNKATNPQVETEPSNFFCSYLEVGKIFRHLHNKTSYGINKIPPIVLKHLPSSVILAYTILFKNALNNYYFPKPWKCAKVLPILKKGKNPNDLSSYRPVSLTSSISKVFDATINSRIQHFCKTNKIIPNHQFGFKHQHSTTHAIHKLLNHINLNLHAKELVRAALLDLEKVFDSVWHNGLVFKLIDKHFPKPLIYIIWDSISQKSFKTWNCTTFSTEEFYITEGLQQGTVNSPILFNIYTRNVLTLPGFKNNGPTSSIAFADDVIIYTSGRHPPAIQNALETEVEKVNQWYIKWNLRLNPNKCETILFRRPMMQLSRLNQTNINHFKIEATVPGSLQKTTIPHKKLVKYLGVHLDYLLRGNKHRYPSPQSSNSLQSKYTYLLQ